MKGLKKIMSMITHPEENKKLKKWQSKLDIARLALLIYNSGTLFAIEQKQAFKKWYNRFCSIIGKEANENYKKNKLKYEFGNKYSYFHE